MNGPDRLRIGVEKWVDEIHIQFSGINYTEKGERNHIETKREELKELISHLPKNKNITIINESPNPVEDSIKALEIYGKT